MNYLVMEVKTSYCVVLDSHGRFLKAANFGHQVGDTLQEIYPMESPKKPKGKVYAFAVTAAALVASLVLVFVGAWQANAKVYGSVYFAVNPQVKIELNKKNNVLSLTGENPQGTDLVATYQGKGKDIYQVTHELIDRSLAQGYLKEKGNVTLAIDSPDETWHQALGIALREEAATPLSQEQQVNIAVVTYSQDTFGDWTPSEVPEEVSSESSKKPQETSEETSLPQESQTRREESQESHESTSQGSDKPAPQREQERSQAHHSSKESPAASSGASTSSSPSSSSTSPASDQRTPQEITLAKAKEIALAHAGISAQQATFTKAKTDTEDGLPVFELEFETSDAKYECEIVRTDGSVHSFEKKEKKHQSSSHQETQDPLTPEQALNIALGHAGARRAQVYDVSVDYDRDDQHYEVEFDWGEKEYEYDIHAITGEILDFDIDD